MRRFALFLAALTLALALSAPAAPAEFGLRDLEVTFENADGTTAVKAGSHPFAMTTTLFVNTEQVPGGAKDPNTNEPVDAEVPEGEIKDLTITQMPGLVGAQTAIPTCSFAEFANRTLGYPACPDETAVGIAAVKAEFSAFVVGANDSLHLPIYNLAPPPGVAATFGFLAANVPIVFDVAVSESAPYNLVVRLRDIPQALLFYGSKVTLWGNPADSRHDSLRGHCVGLPFTPTPEPVSSGDCPVKTSEKPLLTLPRSCKGPLPTLFAALSWQGAFDESAATTEGMSDCGLLTFSPHTSAQPTTASAESPSGIDFGLDVEDEGLTSSAGTAQADIAAVTATLPAGMTANPSAAEGLGVCTEAQYEAASLANRGCPSEAKLGSVQISSPLLEEAISGSLYIAKPHENPFDSLLAAYLLIRSPRFGLFVKQAGEILPNPQTGQLTTSFDEIPELPFAHLTLHFREGPRAPLVTPPTCGTYTTLTELTPSSGLAPLLSASDFDVTSGPNGAPCPPGGIPPFQPGFQAGALNNTAGAYSPFYMRLTRKDGEQDMTRFDSVLPPGVVGKIAGVARCPEEAIAAAKLKTGTEELASPSCPASSQIGRILAGAGVGPLLTWVPGTIYLAGPFAGDPLSVVVITPAVAGPFDVGTVVTREALDLDPTTAEVRVDGAASDPIPHILAGIPLKLRDLRVFLDRPEFTLNATDCTPAIVGATLFGSGADPFNPADDQSAGLSARYQAANCGNLGFKPKLTLKFKGGTKRSGHPALRSTLVPRPGDANIGSAVVTLPPSEFIDNAHINNPCTRVQFNANACPEGSVLGTARAFTPLLDQPLEGPVYFRSNGGERKLPDIVADLHGQFHIVLVGFVDSRKGRVRTRFLNVPDAPVSKFELNLFGGKRGLLENNRDLCAGKKLRAKLALTGQNGRRWDSEPVLSTPCKQGNRPK